MQEAVEAQQSPREPDEKLIQGASAARQATENNRYKKR
jgi:hypothetical protein